MNALSGFAIVVQFSSMFGVNHDYFSRGRISNHSGERAQEIIKITESGVNFCSIAAQIV
jgi:hypothetical protein